MSSSDSGTPMAARMLMSVQRFEGAGLFAIGSLCASCCCCGAGAADAVACILGLVLSAGLAAGGGFASASAGLSGFSRGTPAERHGVLHGLASAAACAVGPKSAITVATTAIATRGEEHAG
ncbi:hypothetical protein J2W32_006136 [Variovorax boronicumulans]|uniref:Uncharacterized protein n=1 Tax=Variovorax boronicumulans TaxID=436515 RepID=A0AAW8D6P0_9BURK|nr:hypothetical protein [Variovorax boronicumulans]MDP9897021.1 hypothetical protein [Variovorax boronicumulans]MDQ0057061.1 hypothetical protein [Variovorax boronicumulans]